MSVCGYLDRWVNACVHTCVCVSLCSPLNTWSTTSANPEYLNILIFVQSNRIFSMQMLLVPFFFFFLMGTFSSSWFQYYYNLWYIFKAQVEGWVSFNLKSQVRSQERTCRKHGRVRDFCLRLRALQPQLGNGSHHQKGQTWGGSTWVSTNNPMLLN